MLFAAILALLLSGCLSVYKVEVQQGKVITQERIDKLSPA
jgi:outer membrane protein assembly factor BamE (lipoprotein component of BamABCDE complex)